MARKLRIQYPGAIYHVMNRGDRQEPVSGDDRDRRRFLETLTEACQKTGWQAHAFCLMSNHFHLVVQPPQPNLVAGMKWFLGAYTSRYNRRRKEFRRELLEQVSARPGPRHFGEAVQEASEAQAERLVVEGLKRLGWTEEVLRAKRKGDASKVALARELRSRTTMPLAWIAERLWMGRRGVPGLAVGPPGGGFGRQPGGAGGAAFMTISLTDPLMHRNEPYRLDIFAASIKDGRDHQLHRRLFAVRPKQAKPNAAQMEMAAVLNEARQSTPGTVRASGRGTNRGQGRAHRHHRPRPHPPIRAPLRRRP